MPETAHGVAVVGATGYGGAVCALLVRRHPSLDLVAVTARSDAGRRHDELYPRYRVPLELEPFDPDRLAERADAALVAYPHGAAAPAVKALRERGLKVVDLSADFRLADPAAYARWYGHDHHAPELQKEAIYGLTEVYRKEIAAARLVANPGCYTTCAQLPLIPLLRANAIDPSRVLGAIDFDRVSFGYEGDAHVLHDVSFSIRPNIFGNQK